MVPLRCQFARNSQVTVPFLPFKLQTFVKRLFNGIVNDGEWAFDVGIADLQVGSKLETET